MKRPRILLSALLAIAAAPAAHAQEPSLLGLGNGAWNTLGLPLLEIDGRCAIRPVCALDPSALTARVQTPAGGLAHDHRSGRTWATDGHTLLVTDAGCPTGRACPIPAAAFPPWTGLAVDPTGNTLLFTNASTTNVYAIAASCPLGAARVVCTVPPIGSGGPFTGLDVDPWDGSLWITDLLGNVFRVEDLGTGTCDVVAALRTSCPTSPPFRPIHGLAIDRCRDAVYLADDRGGILRRSLHPAVFDCCVAPALPNGFHFVGLARRPAPARTLGHGCSQGACPPCIPRAHVTSPAVLPNPAFAIALRDASPGNAAFLLLGPPGPPTALPSLCAPLQVPLVPTPLFLGPLGVGPQTGGGPCDGGTRLPLPLPVDAALCGATVHAQWMVGCLGAGGASGFQWSDGLAITIS